MSTKFLKISLVLLILSILQSCPSIGEEVCDGIEASATIPDLITISPLKQIYNQGDEITYYLAIPSKNNYFGDPVDLYYKTKISNGWYIASTTQLFDSNNITYIKGSKKNGAENWYNITYNSANDYYELEIKVQLNKVGNYSLFADDRIDFLGSDKCNRNFIYTNIKGKNADNKIEFKVQ